MKLRLIFPWFCVLASLAGLAVVVSNSQKQAMELAALRSDSEQLQKLREQQEEGKQASDQAANEELVRLRKDHEELMRLRNEVRQLRGERQQLAGQVQSAQAAAQNAQAEAQAQALKAAQAPPVPAPGSQASPGAAPSTPDLQAALKARYGLAVTPEQANATGCVNNLRQIDGAKQQWALEKGKPAGALLTAGDLAAYLSNKTLPTCPAGGVYTLNPVGIEPLCNIPGHALPK